MNARLREKARALARARRRRHRLAMQGKRLRIKTVVDEVTGETRRVVVEEQLPTTPATVLPVLGLVAVIGAAWWFWKRSKAKGGAPAA